MEENKQPNQNKYTQLFAISSQMTASIVGFAIVGYFLDDFYHVEKHYFTLAFTLVGIFVGLYLLMQGIKNINN
ncbi:hypothetical protein GO491_10670 [Flavobacteriaceae bacterium Ap0902]|nr:hypothetical protein [Flavobacteriaceae bacterium Ap0902]